MNKLHNHDHNDHNDHSKNHNTNHNRIVVIGGGLAGLTTCLEAASNNNFKEILLLEKGKIGGNSMKATSGINGLAKMTQSSSDRFIEDVVQSSQTDYRSDLVTTLVTRSESALNWLRDKGIVLDEPRLLGGHRSPRSHRVLDRETGEPRHVGSTLILQLKRLCSENKAIKLSESSKVTRLLKRGQAVVGVEYIDSSGEKRTVQTDRVVLTTGGYSANKKLVQELNPDYCCLGTTNGSFAQGEGLVLGTGVGAATVGIRHVQLHPTGFVHPDKRDQQEQILAPEIFRSLGGILVDATGSRFTNELGIRLDVVRDIFQYGDQSLKKGKPTVFLIVSEEMAQTFGKTMFNFYVQQGLFRPCENIYEISQLIKDETVIGNLLNAIYHAKMNPPFYLAIVSPVIHYTMGGLAINSQAEVLDQSEKPISGLYAAGEVTGGVHGINRLAGNSLLECLVFGRIAGSVS